VRNSFIDSLIRFNDEGGRAFLLVGDLGYSVVEEFCEKYPDYFINVGVAEQNMAGIAAGIASEGFQVFYYSIGNFGTFRCAEQFRNDIDYHNLPVCSVSVGGGVAYGNMGYSHHAIQDMALMRAMPNTTIYAPVDGNETQRCFNTIVASNAPSYLRLHKSGERQISNRNSQVKHGVPCHISGSRNAKRIILTTGYCGQGAFNYVQRNSDWSHFSMPAWGLRCKDYISSFLDEFDEVLVIEDHLIDGGFCSWVLESVMGSPNILKIRSKSLLPASIGLVGSESYLHDYSKLFVF
jgi:transketolase